MAVVDHLDFGGTCALRGCDPKKMLVAAAQAPEAVAMEPRRWPKYNARLGRNRRLYGRLYDSGDPRLDKVVRWSRFADWLSGAEENPPPMALLPGEGLPPAEVADDPVVVMQPFSAVRQKQSPPALYRRLIESLPSGTRVVITGTRSDLDTNGEFKTLLDLPGVTFDDRVFQDLVPMLRGARLVVSVDTALMHLAVAVGAPTLCLASAAYVGEIVPYDPVITPPNARFVYHSMPCEGCLGDCILAAENGMFPCVARLDEDQILAAARSMMADPAEKDR
ncbi:MAG: hypothetical protein IIA35_07205 [Proteobacteria bacterium]|nr:hypothetical protein [Pseudomonadota bacterium]